MKTLGKNGVVRGGKSLDPGMTSSVLLYCEFMGKIQGGREGALYHVCSLVPEACLRALTPAPSSGLRSRLVGQNTEIEPNTPKVYVDLIFLSIINMLVAKQTGTGVETSRLAAGRRHQ